MWRIPFSFLLTSKSPRLSALPMPEEVSQQVDAGKFTRNGEQLPQRWKRQRENRLGAIGPRTRRHNLLSKILKSALLFTGYWCSCKVATLNCMASKLYYLAGQKRGKLLLWAGLIGIRINVDLNAKVNISSGSQILVYVFYYLCTIYIINLKKPY